MRHVNGMPIIGIVTNSKNLNTCFDEWAFICEKRRKVSTV
jgi:hypothetical protein